MIDNNNWIAKQQSLQQRRIINNSNDNEIVIQSQNKSLFIENDIEIVKKD